MTKDLSTIIRFALSGVLTLLIPYSGMSFIIWDLHWYSIIEEWLVISRVMFLVVYLYFSGLVFVFFLTLTDKGNW